LMRMTKYRLGWTRAYRLRIRAENLIWINALKVSRGCKDCGYNQHAVALDFDHLRDKKLKIAQSLHRGRQVVEREIAKCDVVCANCHRVRTHWRRQSQKSLLKQAGLA
jgi:hypothetical protein